MSDKRLPFKLLSNEWDNVKRKGHPKKILACPDGFFKERIGSPRESRGYKTSQKALDKSECEDFEMALQHKSKL